MSGARSSSLPRPVDGGRRQLALDLAQRAADQPSLGVGQAVELGGELDLVAALGERDGRPPRSAGRDRRRSRRAAAPFRSPRRRRRPRRAAHPPDRRSTRPRRRRHRARPRRCRRRSAPTAPSARRPRASRTRRATPPSAAQLGPELGRRRGDPLAHLGDVGVGEVAVGGLQAQPVGEAATALGDAIAAVHVEQVEIDEQRAGALADRPWRASRPGRPRAGRRRGRDRSRGSGSSAATAPAWARGRAPGADRARRRRRGRRSRTHRAPPGRPRRPPRSSSRPATSVAERVGWRPAGTIDWSTRAPTPIAAAISRHTATAAGASSPARTTPSASYSSGSSPGPGG